jgi:uncharacterized protein YbcI
MNSSPATLGGLLASKPTWWNVVVHHVGFCLTALSPAEKAVAQSPAAALQLQDYHRQLFVNAVDALRQEITRITGVEVRDATAEIETNTGAIMQIFATGTVVQVFLLASAVPGESWTGSVRAKQS